MALENVDKHDERVKSVFGKTGDDHIDALNMWLETRGCMLDEFPSTKDQPGMEQYFAARIKSARTFGIPIKALPIPKYLHEHFDKFKASQKA